MLVYSVKKGESMRIERILNLIAPFGDVDGVLNPASCKSDPVHVLIKVILTAQNVSHETPTNRYVVKVHIL